MRTWDEIFVDSGFVEYAYFEGNPHYRRHQQKLFIDGEIYAPDYDYPKLITGSSFVFDKAKLRAKRYTLKALTLHFGADKAKLYYAKLKRDYLKRLLVEEAEQIKRARPGSRARRASEKKFMEINHELFGSLDEVMFYGMIATERNTIAGFRPADTFGVKIKYHLLTLLERVPEGYKEKVLIDEKLLSLYAPLIQERYGNVMSAIEETKEKMDADDCVKNMNRALQAGGLYQNGWRAAVDPAKAVVATFSPDKKIYLPLHTRRSTSELRRLVMHEQEVHARRSENGSQYEDFPLMERGTSRYTDVEEGMGVYLEAVMTGNVRNQAIERARMRYIAVGLALGTDGCKRDAVQTYDIIWRLLAVKMAAAKGSLTDRIIRKAKAQAMVIIENIFRGTDFVTPGLCYIKAKVYYEGLVKHVKYARRIAADPLLFDEQFLGKYDHTNRRERETVLSIIS